MRWHPALPGYVPTDPCPWGQHRTGKVRCCTQLSRPPTNKTNPVAVSTIAYRKGHLRRERKRGSVIAHNIEAPLNGLGNARLGIAAGKQGILYLLGEGGVEAPTTSQPPSMAELFTQRDRR